MQPKQEYSAAEVAELLPITQRQVNNWCNMGVFPHAYRRGLRREWRISHDDLVAAARKYNYKLDFG